MIDYSFPYNLKAVIAGEGPQIILSFRMPNFQAFDLDVTDPGQVSFDLPFYYAPGTYALRVFLNGLLQSVLNNDYAETSSSSITFTDQIVALGDTTKVFVEAPSARVQIRRKRYDFPSHITDGILVADIADTANSIQVVSDRDLTAPETFYYSLFVERNSEWVTNSQMQVKQLAISTGLFETRLWKRITPLFVTLDKTGLPQ